jgi:hypothetical protein
MFVCLATPCRVARPHPAPLQCPPPPTPGRPAGNRFSSVVEDEHRVVKVFDVRRAGLDPCDVLRPSHKKRVLHATWVPSDPRALLTTSFDRSVHSYSL